MFHAYLELQLLNALRLLRVILTLKPLGMVILVGL